jgi:Domain of unknown function (DUF6754)
VNLSNILGTGILGLVFVLVFFGLMILFVVYSRTRQAGVFRPIHAFDRLRREIGLAVEAGKRLHVSLGRGGLVGMEGGSALVGLTILERIARTASVSDQPPVATSGDGSVAILSQDTTYNVFQSIGAESQFDPSFGRLTGLTPFAYAAGVIPVISDEQVAMTVLAGHFGSELALIADAAERNNSVTLAGSDDITAQAVLYATADEPLIGEELYAAGAYLKSGPLHTASLRAQDIIRWALVAIILAGAALKLVGLI